MNFGNNEPGPENEDSKEEMKEGENLKDELEFDEFIDLIKGMLAYNPDIILISPLFHPFISF